MGGVLESVDESGCGLRVTFEWLGDRFRHRVDVVRQGTGYPLLESVEGDDQTEWPPSPPLQQLTIEPRPAGPVGLMVGMAGRSHWSASVACIAAQRAVEFDFACRLAAAADRLGSRYRLLETAGVGTWELGDAGGVASLTAAQCRLHCEPFDEQSSASIDDARGLNIEPRANPQTTARWQYRLRLEGISE